MKSYKLFTEAVKPKIGNYVLCKMDADENDNDTKLGDYVESHVGQIIGKQLTEDERNLRKVSPEEFEKYQLKKAANKYNI